jgi:hypothetical protein
MDIVSQKYLFRAVKLYKPVELRDKSSIISIYLNEDIKHVIRVLEAKLGSTIPVLYDINTRREYAQIIIYKRIDTLLSALSTDMIYDFTLKIKCANIGANITWRIVSIEANLDNLIIKDEPEQNIVDDVIDDIDDMDLYHDIREKYITNIYDMVNTLTVKEKELCELRNKLETDTYMIVNSFNIDNCPKYDNILKKYEKIIDRL